MAEAPVAGARLALSVGVLIAIPLLALNLRPAVTSVGSMLTEIESGTGMSAVLASTIVAAPVWCFAVGGALAWAMRTRFGTARTVSLALAALAATLAARVLSGPLLLLGGTVVACLAIAVLGTLLPVITHAAPPRAWALLTGCYVAALGGGSGIGALITPEVAGHSSWQLGVSGWALLAVAAWAAWRVASRRFVEPPVRATKHPGPRSLAPARTAWSLTIHFGLTSGFTFSMMGWLPSILLDYSRVSPAQAQWMFTVAMALGVPIALLVPKWARAGKYGQSGLAVALAVPSLVATVGLLMFPAWSPWLWSIGLGLGMPAVGLALAMISMRAAPDGDSAAALSSMVQGIGYAIAGVTALACGLLHSTTQTWDWPMLALLVVLCGQIMAGMHAGLPITVRAGARASKKAAVPAQREPAQLPPARRALPAARAHTPALRPPMPARRAAPNPLTGPPLYYPVAQLAGPVSGGVLVPVTGLGPRPANASVRPTHGPPGPTPPMRGPNGSRPLVSWQGAPLPPWQRPIVPGRGPSGPPRSGNGVPPMPGGIPEPRSPKDRVPDSAIASASPTESLTSRPAVAESSPTDVLVPKPRAGSSRPALADASATEVVVPRSRGESRPAVAEASATEVMVPKPPAGSRPAVADASATEVVFPRSRGELRPVVAEPSATEVVVPKPRVGSSSPAVADASATEVVVPRSRGGSGPAVADASATEVVVPRPRAESSRPAVAEASATEVVAPRSRTESSRPAVAEASATEVVVPRSGRQLVSGVLEPSATEVPGPRAESSTSAVAEPSATDVVVPASRGVASPVTGSPGTESPVPGVAEASATEVVVARSRAESSKPVVDESSAADVVAPEPRGEMSDVAAGESSGTEVVVPLPRSESVSGVVESSATDVAVPKPRNEISESAVTGAMIPEPRTGEPDLESPASDTAAEASDAVVSEPHAAESPKTEPPKAEAVVHASGTDGARAVAAVVPWVRDSRIPVQLELALFEPEPVPAPAPDAVRDRTIHIPYPRRPSM